MAATSELLRSLKQRSFLALWMGQTISGFGDSLYRFALVWWVLKATGSGLAIGTVVICQSLPMIPFLLVGGAVVDRFNRIKIMLYSDLARGVLTAAVAYLAMSGKLEVWHVYIAATMFGFVDAFFRPAYAAVVPALVPAEDLPSANSLTVLSERITSVGGPVVGALIVSSGGTPLAFAIDGTTFFISALCLAPLLRTVNQAASSGPSNSVIADMREGIALVRAEPWLWISIANFAFYNATDYAAFAVTLPYLITQTMGYDAATLGLVESFYSVGTVAAAIWLGRRAKIPRRGMVMYGCALGVGVCTVALGFPITIVGIAVFTLMRGAGLTVAGLVWTNLVQERVPADKLGRVSAIDWMGSIVLLPVGFAIIGWATDHADPSAVFIAVGILGLIITGASMLHPKIRALD